MLDAKYDVLAWNPLAAALITDFSALPPRERNLLRLRFLAGRQTELFGETGHPGVRPGRGRRSAGGDQDVPERSGRSPSWSTTCWPAVEEFAEIWARHEVGRQQSLCQTIFHPTVGRIDVICEVLVMPERDQRVVLYTAEPGSPSEQAIRLLDVIGLQELTTKP